MRFAGRSISGERVQSVEVITLIIMILGKFEADFSMICGSESGHGNGRRSVMPAVRAKKGMMEGGLVGEGLLPCFSSSTIPTGRGAQEFNQPRRG